METTTKKRKLGTRVPVKAGTLESITIIDVNVVREALSSGKVTSLSPERQHMLKAMRVAWGLMERYPQKQQCANHLAELLEREGALVAYLCERLQSLDYVDVIGPSDPRRHVGVVSFNVRGVHPHDVASLLDTRDVCIRAGHHCAQPLLAWLGVENGSSCRASVALYNESADIDRLVEGLEYVWSIFHG
jgi:selenocysteine lyase/cysteine desulfurase